MGLRHQHSAAEVNGLSKRMRMMKIRRGTAERATGLEPATSSLGSWHSTTELRPRTVGR